VKSRNNSLPVLEPLVEQPEEAANVGNGVVALSEIKWCAWIGLLMVYFLSGQDHPLSSCQ
jgi:hypothetical protein